MVRGLAQALVASEAVYSNPKTNAPNHLKPSFHGSVVASK
jgi:hypothetical protein